MKSKEEKNKNKIAPKEENDIKVLKLLKNILAKTNEFNRKNKI